MAVSGKCDPKFKRVREEFERNFKEREEVGASVCVTLEGETVIDLWGGTADVDTGDPWKKDTVSIVFSATKGLQLSVPISSLPGASWISMRP